MHHCCLATITKSRIRLTLLRLSAANPAARSRGPAHHPSRNAPPHCKPQLRRDHGAEPRPPCFDRRHTARNLPLTRIQSSNAAPPFPALPNPSLTSESVKERLHHGCALCSADFHHLQLRVALPFHRHRQLQRPAASVRVNHLTDCVPIALRHRVLHRLPHPQDF